MEPRRLGSRPWTWGAESLPCLHLGGATEPSRQARAQRPEDGESGQASLPAPAASTLERKQKPRRKLVGSGPGNKGRAFPSDRLAVPGPVGPHLVASL